MQIPAITESFVPVKFYIPGKHDIPIIEVGPHPVPPAKVIVQSMDYYISNHVQWNNFDDWSKLMETYFTSDFKYITIYGLGEFTGITNWFYGEHIPFNFAFPDVTFSQLIFVGDDIHASTTTYAKCTWQNEFVGVKPSGTQVSIRIHDFYRIDPEQKKISVNWMMIDVVDLMRQAGYQVLAKPRAKEGWFQPPRAMDGIPAPIAFPIKILSPEQKHKYESLVVDTVHRDWVGQEYSASNWADDMVFYGPGGIGFMPNKDWYITDFLAPLHEAFSKPEIKMDVLVCQQNYCAVNGLFEAVQSGVWLGEPPAAKRRKLRFGMHFRLNKETMQIEDGYLMLDLVQYFAEVGTYLTDRTHDEYRVQ